MLGISATAFLVGLAGPAAAQAYPGGGASPPPSVLGQTVFPSSGAGGGGGGTLAFTGLELLLLVALALGLLVTGAVIYRVSRRSSV